MSLLTDYSSGIHIEALLYLIHNNNITNLPCTIDIIVYVDDTKLIFIAWPLIEAQTMVNNYEGANSGRNAINFPETYLNKIILFSGPLLLFIFVLLVINSGDTKIHQLASIECLGVWFRQTFVGMHT